ncbi:MAG: DUF1576 domain-containing protein [Clostridiales bacterium]|nr:DUF1576 domain-containing protein [Clostridiales bacterium]
MQKKTYNNSVAYLSMYSFGAILILFAFIFDTPLEIGEGFLLILTSPSNLITDYFEIGGIGASFLNSGLILILSAFSLHLNRIKLKGEAVAGLVTVCGFALFGKNLYNSIPIAAGTYLYAYVMKLPPHEVAIPGLFATALGPLVSTLSFGLGLGLYRGLAIGCAAGLIIGFIIIPLAKSFFNFHRGFNLYNIGFTAGIIGMFAAGILRMFNLKIESVSIISQGNNLPLSIILLFVFLFFLLLGLHRNNYSFKGYSKLLKQTGRLKSDFIESCGLGVTLINISLMGFIGWLYVMLIGGQLNGASLGAIFTLMGFSAYGNHPKNTLPIFAGAFLASILNIHEPNSTLSVIATIFGSTLAPIAGYFGLISGIIAGFAHVSMSLNVSYLHGGMNLYNNGFSGAFIAATLVPLFETFGKRKNGIKEDSARPYLSPLSHYNLRNIK